MALSKNQYIEVKSSGIHQRGVFAKQDIPKGTRIIEYIGQKITKAESLKRAIATFDKSKKKQTGAVYIFTLNKRYDLDGTVGGNESRFINHGCWTNCESDVIGGRIWIIAKKNISQGDELVYDYGFEFDPEDFKEYPCYCGHQRCRKYIVAHDQYHLLKRALEK